MPARMLVPFAYKSMAVHLILEYMEILILHSRKLFFQAIDWICFLKFQFSSLPGYLLSPFLITFSYLRFLFLKLSCFSTSSNMIGIR